MYARTEGRQISMAGYRCYICFIVVTFALLVSAVLVLYALKRKAEPLTSLFVIDSRKKVFVKRNLRPAASHQCEQQLGYRLAVTWRAASAPVPVRLAYFGL